MGMDSRNPQGFSLVELLLGAGILSVVLLVLATSGMFMTRLLSKKELTYLRAQQLEQRLIEALQENNNFEFKTRNYMRDGARFPAFTLSFGSAVELKMDAIEESTNVDIKTDFEIPQPDRLLSNVKASVNYYDLDGVKCGPSETDDCPIGVAISMIQIAGTYDYYTYGGTVDYLEEDSRKDKATTPVFALAYRIMVPAPEMVDRKPASEDDVDLRPYISLGAKVVAPSDIGKFEFEDYTTTLPGEVYLEVNGEWNCPDGSYIRGIDPFYQSPVCLRMGSNCVKGELGKQLQISGNTLYVDCVPFKKYECTDSEYVISWISPKYLDSDYSGAEKPGQCVYKGVKRDSRKISGNAGQMDIQERCGSKYEMKVNCGGHAKIISNCVGPADPETGVAPEVAPNVPSVGGLKSKLGTNSYNCRLDVGPKPEVCPAGYSGGSYSVHVDMETTCELRPEDEYRPLKGF